MRWVRLLWPVLLAMVQALFAAGTAVYAATWDLQPLEYQIAALGAVGFGLVNVAAVVHGRYELQQAKLESSSRDALQTALSKIQGVLRGSSPHIGLHAYQASWGIVGLRPRFLQRRIARLRVEERKPRSRMVWLKAKGVVGRCWQREVKVVHMDFFNTHAHLRGCDEETWKKQSEAIRMGLTHDEWVDMQAYDLIMAYPIQESSRWGKAKYRGCVSIDASDPELAKKLLASAELHKILANAANAIATDIKGA